MCFWWKRVKLVYALVRKQTFSLYAFEEEPVLNFGKYKGKPLSQLNDGYLRWMQTTMVSELWGKAASKVLDERNSSKVLLAELKACSRARNLQLGKRLHAEAVKCRHDSRLYIANALMNMYAKCGSMVDARQVFERLKQPDAVSWNVLILGYADNGKGHMALDLFSRMRSEGPSPDSLTIVAALKACTSLAVKGAKCRHIGQEIHKFAAENCCNLDGFVQSTLVDMYAKCGSMVDAREVFDSMKHPDVVSWTALILGYANNGQGRTALNIFARMRIEGPAPNSVTFVAALKACISLAVKEGASRWGECRDRGKEIHKFAKENGCDSDVYFQNTLVDMYAKCGSMVDAREVFDSLKHPTVVSWTALILGYADNEEGDTALNLFAKMRTEGPAPDSVTFLAALKACTTLTEKGGSSRWAECRKRGKEIQILALANGCNVYVQNTLVDMYAKCGSMVDAQEVFNSIKNPTVVSWNALIMGYADTGQGHTALDLFARMRTEGPAPNAVSFSAVLKACGLVGALEFGRKIHSEIDSGNHLNVVLVTCLVDFYAKCGCLVEAQSIFNSHPEARDLITWTALLAGFSSCGEHEAAFELLEGMQDAGFRPNGVTFLCILTCCSHAGLVEKGKECFDAMPTSYGIVPTIEHYTCMIDIFGRANKLDEAMSLLESMPYSPNNVTWMIILDACRKWKNVEIGKVAFESLINSNDKEAAGYLLMEQIYGRRGQEKVVAGESCWSNEVGEVHRFLVADSRHPQLREIHSKWESMMRQNGYASLLTSEKEEALCGHSERLALVCALINTGPRKMIRIVKNLRVCKDCHIAIALISKLECRTIIVRDTSRIHVFKDGNCSCE